MWNVQDPFYIINHGLTMAVTRAAAPCCLLSLRTGRSHCCFWEYIPYLAPALKGIIEFMFVSELLEVLKLEGTLGHDSDPLLIA